MKEIRHAYVNMKDIIHGLHEGHCLCEYKGHKTWSIQNTLTSHAGIISPKFGVAALNPRISSMVASMVLLLCLVLIYNTLWYFYCHAQPLNFVLFCRLKESYLWDLSVDEKDMFGVEHKTLYSEFLDFNKVQFQN